jgi:Na+/melibiose symporter-like transporter
MTSGKRRRPVALALCGVSLVASLVVPGCATSRGRPQSLALAGAGVALGGSAMWVVGEQRAQPGSLPTVGLLVVAAGVIGMIAAGGWMAAQVACNADPDCNDTEECREIPAPPGGVPYKQCTPR